MKSIFRADMREAKNTNSYASVEFICRGLINYARSRAACPTRQRGHSRRQSPKDFVDDEGLFVHNFMVYLLYKAVCPE